MAAQLVTEAYVWRHTPHEPNRYCEQTLWHTIKCHVQEAIYLNDLFVGLIVYLNGCNGLLHLS